MASPSAAPAAKKSAFGGHGLILAGLMLGVLLAALDQTVVGTSLPKIVADLHDFQHLSALITAYLLASTVAIPIAGKLSDLYGRRPIYLTGMVLFLAGSALCGLAGQWGDWNLGSVTVTGMWQLILFRFIQGLGGGAIFPVALATIADLYSPSDRGRVQGLFGAVFGLSSVIGPFIGGWIVDNLFIGDIAPWRWVFYVNLPVGIVGIAMVATHFPRKSGTAGVNIDWTGIASITTALTAFILVAMWGGNDYAWGSAQILGLLALGLAAVAVFIFAEARAKDPIIPMGLWKEPIFTVSAIASILMGSAMFGVIGYMPTYMQGVVGISATYSGAVLVPLTLTLVAGSIISGQLMKRFGYKPFTMLGAAISSVAFAVLYFLSRDSVPPVWEAIAVMMVLGIGIGFSIQTFTVAVQNAVERRYIGTGTASITLFRTLGATLGIAALGAILNEQMSTIMPERVAASTPQVQRIYAGALANPNVGGKIQNLPQGLVSQPFLDAMHAVPGGDAFVLVLKDAFGSSMSYVWLAGALIAAVGFVVTIFLKGKALKTAEEYHGESAPPPSAAMH
jgi:EmrB/QacA subfamily drug resistance transporter